MTITLDTVQSLAPDQASLTAAKKLLKPAKWPVKQCLDDKELIWGHCQGSGANPYYTVVDTNNHGYKCTCPSRKFPCKHVLALMWQYADDEDGFSVADVPSWVSDWLGRRRIKSSVNLEGESELAQSEDKEKSNKKSSASMAKILADEKTDIDPEAEAKKQAAAIKRAEKLRLATNKAISAGLKEYQQWLNDQLRTGLINFLEHASERCRKISARLVDAKATTLAARLDELPAKLMNVPKDNQLRVATNEFGKMVCLAQAWQKNPEDLDVRRAIGTAESRDSVLESPNRFTQQGIWQVVAEQIENRRDGLISHATWLRYLGQLSDDGSFVFMQATDDQQHPIPAVPFALLQDYYPASLGRRGSMATLGSYLFANMVYYPSRYPLRAVMETQQTFDSEMLSAIETLVDKAYGQDKFSLMLNDYQGHSYLPNSLFSFYQGYQQALARMAWLEYMPCLLPSGQIRPMVAQQSNHGTHKKDGVKMLWWQAEASLQEPTQLVWQLPLRPNQYDSQQNLDCVLSCPFTHSFILWDGVYATFGSGYHQHWGQLSW